MNNTITIKDDATLKTSQILQKIRDKMPVYSYWNDEELDKIAPIPEKSTERAFLDSQEPDPETLGLSYNDFTEKGLLVITIREYMLLYLAYYEKTGKKLDKKGLTRTSTLDSDGRVMCGGSNGDGFELDWRDCVRRHPGYGPRSAMLSSSLSLLTLTEQQAIAILKDKGYKITKEEIVVKEY